MFRKLICSCILCISYVVLAIPPELLQQHQNLNIPNSFIDYDTSSKYIVNIVPAGLKVVMPNVPTQKTVEVFTQNEKVIQQQYLSALDVFELKFQLAQRPVNSSQIKNIKTLFLEEKDRFILQFGNYPVIQKISAQQAEYEIIAPNNLIYRIKQIISNSTLVTLIVYGKAPAIYAAPSNDFLNSIEGSDFSNIYNDETLLKPKSNKTNTISSNTSKSEEIKNLGKFQISDSLYNITFYMQPQRNDFVIKNDENIYTVVNYFTVKNAKENQYLISYRKYNKDVESVNVLMNKAADMLAISSNTKIIESRDLEFYKSPSKEFVLESKKSQYTVRYFINNNIFYQLVVKNTKKNIDPKGRQQFFESFLLP
jgi:hypothetical protein